MTKKVNLNVPYLSQRDNRLHPSGTCNTTSVAMCMRYFGIVGSGNGQLEDQLTQRCFDTGLSRHDPYDLRKLFLWKGLKDTFNPYATWKEAKAHLLWGNPLICHGWFTRFGHIIVIRGYDDKGYYVNDPWGEIFYTPGRQPYYDTSRSGANLHYSNRLMNDLAGPDHNKELWLHFVSK